VQFTKDEIPGGYFPLQKIVPISPEQEQRLPDGALGKPQPAQLFQGKFLGALQQSDRAQGK
jgi:hypothetical protein